MPEKTQPKRRKSTEPGRKTPKAPAIGKRAASQPPSQAKNIKTELPMEDGEPLGKEPPNLRTTEGHPQTELSIGRRERRNSPIDPARNYYELVDSPVQCTQRETLALPGFDVSLAPAEDDKLYLGMLFGKNELLTQKVLVGVQCRERRVGFELTHNGRLLRSKTGDGCEAGAAHADVSAPAKEGEELMIFPRTVRVSAAGNTVCHQLANLGKKRIAFKVRCSDNKLFSFNSVYGFVEPHDSTPVKIRRDYGPPKDDTLVIDYLHVPEDAKDAEYSFRAGEIKGCRAFRMVAN